jgi:adenylate cyclase
MNFKYGPLGGTVNLASRVQGLTKYLKRPFLVTGSTRAKLREEFVARRICRTRVVNIEEPVELFEVERKSSAERAGFFRDSEAALDALEHQRFAEAARMAGTLLGSHPGDGPLLLVLSRAAAVLAGTDEKFDSVWVPPGK